MKRASWVCCWGIVAGACVAWGQDPAKDAEVEHGRYLVENVAQCADCHSARNEKGEFVKETWMKGTMLPFAPTVPIPHWYKVSIDITPSGGLWSKWGEDGFRKFLETGINPQGKGPYPPMPAYKMSPKDAAAVVAYLKTLK